MDKIFRITISICLCVFIGCAEVEETDIYVPEVPETPDVVKTTATTVSLSSNTPIEYLLIGNMPDLSDAVIYHIDNEYAHISSLQPYTTYYYQVMKQNRVGTELRGKIKSFTTNINISTPKSSCYYATASNMVTLSTEIQSGSSANVLEYGFCISQTSDKLTLETCDEIIKATGLPSSIDDKHSYSFSGHSNGGQLKKGLITYVRSYIKTDKNVSYSEDNCCFFPVSGIKEDRAYVDLGLPSGTLWTVVNYTGKGDLNYLPTTYNFYYEENYYSANFGIFRMPTYTDAKDLYENCIYNKVKINNTYCAQITSKINGNAIYIPFGGLRNSGGYFYHVGENGSIWLNTQTNDGFWREILFSDESEIGYTYYSYHGYRRNIRLVLDD